MKINRLILRSFLAYLLFGSALASASENVVASIKPIHSLVAGVMEGVAEPRLLVKGAASPHSYSMRPSEAAMLQEARIVFWVGPGLEVFLRAPLETLAGDARVVTLSETEELTLLDRREGGAFEPHEHEEEDQNRPLGGEGAGSHDQTKDMHIWLDPENARVLVRRIAMVLSEEDPKNAAAYQQNAAGLEARISQLIAETESAITGKDNRNFLVFHDAYQYFEHRFGLSAAGSLTVNPEIAPGARRLSQLRKKIAELNASCVFSEPQFDPRLVDVVTEGASVRLGVLDPLGAAIEDGPELYFTLIEKLGSAFADCLS